MSTWLWFVVGVVGLYLLKGLTPLYQHERGAIFTRGRYSGLRGPGLRGKAVWCAALLAAATAGVGDETQEAAMPSAVVREQYEWSNLWWDCANDPSLPRVLLIGDSIACGYSPVVTRLLQGQVHVDRLGTSRSINDPVLAKETTMMLEDCHYVAIHFNNGLHGLHLSGSDYAEGLRQYVSLLTKLAGDSQLIWASSTPITQPNDVVTPADSNAVVTSRNDLAAEVMQESEIPVNDLYSVVLGQGDLRSGDGYHYSEAGYELLGQVVADAILQALQ